jgi:predicted nucleotidyltransferase component of viral defense system
MLMLDKIEQQYLPHLRPFKKNILREYLQYKILEIIFESKLSLKLSFLGGTVLRIVHENDRFSEDLDFDNFGMTKSDFVFLSDEIKKGLENQGYEVEIKNIFKGAYRCKIKLPGVLFNNKLSNLREEKILIQIDSVAHDFDYKPDKKNLNKFDVFTEIFTTPIDILLSQKIYAIFERRRPKGRDFYDVVFLLSLTKPDYKYLDLKLKISSPAVLKQRLLKYIKDLDFDDLAQDVKSFLIRPQSSKKVKMFKEFIKQADL